MASSIALRFIAFLVFAAVVGGSTYGAYQSLQPEELTPRGLTAVAAEPDLAVTPGATFSIAVGVTNKGEVAEDVRVLVRSADGFEPGEPVVVRAPAKNGTGAFVPVTVPADAAPGVVTLTAVAETVNAPVKRAQTTVTVTVLGPDAKAVTEGDGAVVQYVGRLASTGALFDTNVPAYAKVPFPRTDYFRSNARNATVYTDANANLIAGFKDALIGMREGEWRSITLAAEDAYGANDVTVGEARTTTVDRVETLPVREVRVSASEFAELVAGSGKSADAYEVGDHFSTEVRGDAYRFLVTNKTSDGYAYRLDPEVGDAFTMPDLAFWPKSAIVTSANETAITFRIDPSTGEGEAFTYHAYWPNASRVVDVTDDAIVVEHSPSVGTTFQRPARAGGDPIMHEVVAVEDDVIRVSYESPHPLAGEDIVFDVRVLKVLPPRGSA